MSERLSARRKKKRMKQLSPDGKQSAVQCSESTGRSIYIYIIYNRPSFDNIVQCISRTGFHLCKTGTTTQKGVRGSRVCLRAQSSHAKWPLRHSDSWPYAESVRSPARADVCIARLKFSNDPDYRIKNIIDSPPSSSDVNFAVDDMFTVYHTLRVSPCKKKNNNEKQKRKITEVRSRTRSRETRLYAKYKRSVETPSARFAHVLVTTYRMV